LTKLVMAVSRDLDATMRIPELTRALDTEVIAVALDLGLGHELGALRDLALAAGASRCHALDVREEFARDCVIPALAARVAFDEPSALLEELAGPFVAGKLREIGRIEGAQVAGAEAIVTAPSRRTRAVTPTAASLAIAFDGTMPVAINGVTMTLAELMESVETISGMPAVAVLDVAFGELDRSPGQPVLLRCFQGTCSVAAAAAVS
jgi:argininosuccinate synthase